MQSMADTIEAVLITFIVRLLMNPGWLTAA
jgi:hypothetical protein